MESFSRRARPAHTPAVEKSTKAKPPPQGAVEKSTKAKPPPQGALSFEQLIASVEAIVKRPGADDARARLAHALGVAYNPRLAASATEALGLVGEVRTSLDRAALAMTYAAGDVHEILRRASIDKVKRDGIGIEGELTELALKRIDFDVATNAAWRSLLALEGELEDIEAMATTARAT